MFLHIHPGWLLVWGLVGPLLALSPESGSLQGPRSSAGTSGWEQGSMSSGLSVREKGSAGTLVMWLLSQMMRDNETARSCLLWAALNTPSLSHQNLRGDKLCKIAPGIVQDLMLISLNVVPVAVPQRPELSSEQAGQQRAHPAPRQRRLRDGAHPHVDVVRGPVQQLELVSQTGVP